MQDDEGFTGCAKVYTYTPIKQAINSTIKLVTMPGGATSEGARHLAIEVADCARRDVFSEKQFVVASHPGLELDGVFYGAIFVLHSISEWKFNEIKLRDNSPVLDMLVHERHEWHNIHSPPHEFLAGIPHPVAVENHDGEVYRHEGLLVKLVKATSYDAFGAEVNSGIQMRNTNAVGFAEVLGFKRNFDPKQGRNQSVVSAIVYEDAGRFSLRSAIDCRGRTLPYSNVKMEPEVIDDVFAQALSILVHLHVDGMNVDNVVFSVDTKNQFDATLTDCRNAVFGKVEACDIVAEEDESGLSPLPETFNLRRSDPMLRAKKIAKADGRDLGDLSNGLMDLFEVDLYTWARMMAEYRGWGFGPWDRFREPDVEARDEDLVSDDHLPRHQDDGGKAGGSCRPARTSSSSSGTGSRQFQQWYCSRRGNRRGSWCSGRAGRRRTGRATWKPSTGGETFVGWETRRIGCVGHRQVWCAYGRHLLAEGLFMSSSVATRYAGSRRRGAGGYRRVSGSG